MQAAHIHSITIDSLRRFEHVNLRFELPARDKGQWIVFLGENGTGKTTLLQEIALALFDPSYPYYWRDARDASIRIRWSPVKCPVFGYGSQRGGALGGPCREPEPDLMRRADTLFDENASLVRAETWLLKLECAARNNSRDRVFYDAVRHVLKSVLDVESIESWGDRICITKARFGRMLLTELSSSHLTILGWVVDLLARWAEYAHTERYELGERFHESMPCVVIIDELDLHLHPRWQTEIIARLKRLFPLTTFIATTHNPLTLHGTEAGEVHIIRQADDGAMEIIQRDLPKGIRVDQVLTGDWFGLYSTLDRETLDLLDKHRALLREGRLDNDNERLKIECELRHRLGHYADTPAERLAQEIVAEKFDELAKPVIDADRSTLRTLYEQRMAEAMRARRGRSE